MSDSQFSSIPIDDLLQQLKDSPQNFTVQKQFDSSLAIPPVSCEPVKDEDIGDYVIKQSTTLLTSTMYTINELKNVATATNDPETISALAELIKSANSSLDTLNKIHIQNKKSKVAKEVAKIQADARIKQSENQVANANILTIGTRDQILKILEDAKNHKTIEAEIVENKQLPFTIENVPDKEKNKDTK